VVTAAGERPGDAVDVALSRKQWNGI